MISKFLSILAFQLCAWVSITHAQSYLGNEWFIGIPLMKVDFEGSSPQTHSLGTFDSTKFIANSNANICDIGGHLLLATDGIKLYDKQGEFIVGGGEQINNDSIAWYESYDSGYPNSTIILPKNDNQYYVFISTISNYKYMDWYNNGGWFDFNEVRYTVVDMNANDGKGQILEKNKLLLHVDAEPWLNKTNMTACRHANGRDWWLLKPSARQRQKIYKFLVRPNDIVTYEQDMPVNYTNMAYDNVGQSAFNKEGTLYAECNTNSPHTVYNFDRCSGELSLKRVFNAYPFKDTFGAVWGDNTYWQGLCFSPSGRFLYTCDAFNVYQIDLENPIDSLAIRRVSKDTTIMRTPFGFPEYASMQLTPTGVVYLGNWHGISEQINGIMQPDKLGDSCQFKFSYFDCNLSNSNSMLSNTNGPPNMPFYGLGKKVGSPCDTIREVVITNPFAIPNAFSPNGDGLNDTWRILNTYQLLQKGIHLKEVGIYNRWGNEVFKSSDINFVWHANNWASDTYYYYIRYMEANESKLQKGSVIVVR